MCKCILINYLHIKLSTKKLTIYGYAFTLLLIEDLCDL